MSKRAQADPVTQYAMDVLDDKVIAARLVRLACQRHLNDLRDAKTKGLDWRPESAQRVIDFFAQVLKLPENTDASDDDDDTAAYGKPFVLSPFQQFIAGSLFGWYTVTGHRRFRLAYVETAKGSGKALALDTPIPTPTGWTTMGAIQPGDQVFDERGRIVDVLGVSDVMTDHPCFEVVFDDGSSIVADEEHLWWTEQRSFSKRGGQLATAGVPIAARGHWRRGIRTTGQIRDSLRHSNGAYQSANHSIPLTGPLGTSPATLPVSPYVLGVWLGDGDSDCNRITVDDADAELLEHVAACGVEVGERKQSIVSPRAPRYRIGGDGRNQPGLMGTLRTLGVLRNKHIPDVYLRASVDQRLALLQGLMDTDGYIDKRTGACEFTSTNEDLASGAHELIQSLGIKATIRKRPARLNGRIVSSVWRMVFHPPSDLPVFQLQRKAQYQIVRHACRRLSGERRIVDVRSVPSVPVRCISVGSESSLYLAGRSMVPTHNTPFGAGLMLYMLIADGERGAQVYAAAPTLKQAQDAFRDAERMIKASPELNALVTQTVNNLAVMQTGSFFRPISSEKRGLDGKRVHGALVDELHEHPTDVVTVKIRAGTKGRRNALILEITNSGFDLESVCWKHHDYSRQILEGSVQNDAWFAFICHLDACPKCQAAGKIQPSDECPHCDDWKTEGPHWLKANPNLGVSLPWQYLREQVREAIDLPSQRNMIRRLNFCQWTQQATARIPMEAWAACRTKLARSAFEESLKGRACYLGIDLSDKIDLSAVLAIFPREMARALEIKHEGENITVDKAIDVLSYFWMPKNSIQRRAQEDRVPYPEWERGEFLTATAGAMVDHDAIVDFIINVLAKRFQIKSIGIDQAGASAVITRLRRHFGDEFVVEVPQGFRRLNTPSRMVEALILSGNLTHDNNPVMNMCIGNLAFDENSWQEIRPVKINQKKRIDGGVALIDAEFVLLEAKDTQEPIFQMFFTQPRR